MIKGTKKENNPAAPADELPVRRDCFIGILFLSEKGIQPTADSRMPYILFVISFAASPPSMGRKASSSAMMISSKESATVLNTGFRKGT